MNTFHRGERAVQQRAGVADMAERVGRSIGETMPPAAQQFLRAQPFVVLGGADENGRVWSSLVRGEAGFARALDERTLRLDALPPASDPLHEVLRDENAVGLLAIEPATRRRMRLNGRVERQDDSLLIRADQVYSNCPKYIQKRELTGVSNSATGCQAQLDTQLSVEQSRSIERADTFFIASLSPDGADVSHRGGNPGFVRVESGNRLVFPDYAGNAMFNTLGNLEVNPRAGLLFVDFESGGTLQLTGQARVNWNASDIGFPGAERLVEFEIELVVSIQSAIGWKWELLELSPFNPSI